jgi:hypothetical protein
MHKANKGFYVGAFLVGGLGQLIIWETVQFLSMAYPQIRPIRHILTWPASMLSLLSAVVTFILVYKMWAAIQGRGARTSAGRALGFMFIPFFNFYWFFQVYWGWTKDYNRIPESEDVELPFMSEGIALLVCILPLLSTCLMIASMFGGGLENFAEKAAVNVGVQTSMLMSLVNTILMAILFSKICDGINALVDAGLEPIKPQYAVPVEGAKTSGMAIASLVLSICGFCTAGLTAIVGLVLGIVSLRAIRKSQGWLKGTGLAIAGISVSGIALFMIPFVMGITVTAFYNARNRDRVLFSMSNVKDICLAINLYCDDNDGSFPPVQSWLDAIAPYLSDEKNLELTFAPYPGLAYAMNAQLEGRKKQDVKQSDRTILVFEARLLSPPAGDSELLPESPLSRRGYVIGFVDGHAELVRPDRLDELIWTPGTQPLLDDR